MRKRSEVEQEPNRDDEEGEDHQGKEGVGGDFDAGAGIVEFLMGGGGFQCGFLLKRARGRSFG